MSAGARLWRGIGLWAPVAGSAAAIWLLSGRPAPRLGVVLWDKLGHAAAYALFGLLCLRATHGGRPPLRGWPSAGALALAAGYGALDEWHQSWVPGRQASLADWIADALGAVLALGLAAWAVRIAAPRRGAEIGS